MLKFVHRFQSYVPVEPHAGVNAVKVPVDTLQDELGGVHPAEAGLVPLVTLWQLLQEYPVHVPLHRVQLCMLPLVHLTAEADSPPLPLHYGLPRGHSEGDPG